jgi:DDE superfamily endonuclease
MLPVLPILRLWLAPFAAFVTRPTWERVLVLVAGAVLAPGRRTVTAALSVLGRRDEFARFHDVLNRARWSGRSLARILLRWLVAVFVADGPVVVGIDETIERRWGPRISARGISTETRCAPRAATLSRVALDQRHAARPDPRADLGAAFPDRPRAIGTACPAGRPAPQAAGRRGPPIVASGQPLAAG